MNYKIKPLEWEYEDISGIYDDLEGEWSAYNVFGCFFIKKYKDKDELLVSCVFYGSDRTYYDANSLEDGKRICEKIWEDRLKKCLIEDNMKWHESFRDQMIECRDSGNSFIIKNPAKPKDSIIVCAYFKTYCHSKACLDKRCAEEYKRIKDDIY